MTTKQPGRAQWRLFWIFYVIGMAVFAYIATTNAQLATHASPGGILDHQSAATGMRVEQIHDAWKEKGVFGFAQLSMSLDLVFITFATLAGIVGGYLMARAGGARGMLGWVVLGVWTVFGACDYIETSSQLVQVLQDRGSDDLAGLAAAVRPAKMLTFVAGTLMIWAGLIWTWLAARRTSAAPV
jgi:hypothetical protein